MNVEEAKELKNSKYWESVTKELNKRINSCINKLKVCKSEEFKELQLRIKGYEEMIRLPQDVIDRDSV